MRKSHPRKQKNEKQNTRKQSVNKKEANNCIENINNKETSITKSSKHNVPGDKPVSVRPQQEIKPRKILDQ